MKTRKRKRIENLQTNGLEIAKGFLTGFFKTWDYFSSATFFQDGDVIFYNEKGESFQPHIFLPYAGG